MSGVFLSSLLQAQSGTTDLRALKAGSSLNPGVSLNALTLYKQSRQEDGFESTQPNGFLLQEVELQFLADVDPYLRASAALSIHPQDSTGTSSSEPRYAIDPEEVFVETTSIPYVTFKAGRFHAALGRHNLLHTHAFPFIDAPLINQELLGGEGLTETGLSISALAPTPWFLELTTQGFQGQSSALFGNPDSSPFASVSRLRSALDLSDDFTMDLGLSQAIGKNSYHTQTKVVGADLTFKWRPSVGGKYSAFVLGAEYLEGVIPDRPSRSHLLGFSTYVQYQFAQRWWVQARSEGMTDRILGTKEKKYSALLGFFPSEFSGVRLQLDHHLNADSKIQNRVYLQGNYTIGAHLAHTY